jgi:hypothetical protein
MKLKHSNILIWIILFGLIVNIGGAIFSYVSLNINQNSRLQKTEKQQQQFLQNTALILEKRLSEVSQTANSYAQQLTAGNYSKEDIDQQLRTNKLWLNPRVIGIGLAFVPDKHHRKLHSSTYWLNTGTHFESFPYGVDYTLKTPENSWYNDVIYKTGTPIWSKPYYDNSLKQFIFSYSVPIYAGQNKKIIAVLVIDLDLQLIDSIISQYIGEKYATIVADDGSYIYDGDVNKILHHESLLKNLPANLDQRIYRHISQNRCSKICNFNLQDNKSRYLVIYQSFKKLPWTIFAEYDTTQFNKLNRTSDNGLSMLFIGFCIGILIFLNLLITLYRIRNKISIKVFWQC